MKLEIATTHDLQDIIYMYKEVVLDMIRNGIEIWDNSYPSNCFSDDIQNERLYIVRNDENELVSAFVLCDDSSGKSFVEWENQYAKSLYMYRLATSINYKNMGIASMTIEYAKNVAKTKGTEYLRLFVVDVNTPAINLYKRNNFSQARGVYIDKFENGNILTEYGFEIAL